MLPTHQRLDALQAFVAGADEGLVGDREFAVRDRPAQVVLDGLAEMEFLLHRLVEEGEAVATLVLGPVEREIGCLEERRRAFAVAWAHRDAERKRRVDLRRAEIEWRDHRVDDAMSRCGTVRGAVDLRQDQRELVAAKPGEAVAVAYGSPDAFDDADQQAVAGLMAVGVIDVLETVDVDGDERHLRVGSAAGDRCLEHLVEAEAIGQGGQGIDARRACDGLFAFQHGDPAVCLPQQHRKQDTGERQRHEKDDHHRNDDNRGKLVQDR